MLRACCGSRAWVEAMERGRPFASASEVVERGEREWRALGKQDWLEAFRHHPRIGERRLEQTRFAETAAQSGREQSGMNAATDAERAEFERLNREYEERFGHVFLICATGKTAGEMLGQIRERICRSAAEELETAAGEQAQILRIRLERMLES